MNQPTKIIVKDGTGRPENPYSHDDIEGQQWYDFERSVTEHPCPSIANTEPGETILAELRWRYYDVVYDCWRIDERAKDFKGCDIEQIWVPIVEQKEGEVKFGEWVSAGIKVPLNNAKVLITDGNIIKTAYFNTDNGKWQVSGFKIKVTHWMPLPSPPITEK
jgi:hypothetical protein